MKTLIQNVTALLMDENNTVLQNAYVAVDGDKIQSVGTQRPAGTFQEVIHGKGQVLMPGFVNCHTHVPMALLRGYGGGCDLQHWLNDWIFPAEAKLDERCVAAGAALGLAEMIASGTTCIADMYMKTGTIAKTVLEAGISANLSCGGVYFGDPADFSPDTCNDCQNQIALTEEWHGAGDGQILVDASIHAEYTSSAPLWQWMADYAQKHNLRMHVHVSETDREHQECCQRHGLTPAQILDQYGVWANGGIAAHCVYLSGRDAELLAERGVAAVHNPVSNLKLMSGVAPLFFLREQGMNIALGTDGVASNNSHNMFEEMKTAALVQNYRFGEDHGQLSAADILRMATVNGARALGRNAGVIAPGKTADLILVDFTAPNLFPCHDVMENLVYSAAPSNVTMNMARGKVIYKDGVYHTIDLERVRREVSEYALPHVFGHQGLFGGPSSVTFN